VHAKNISRDLGGAKSASFFGCESPEDFILNALAPHFPQSAYTPAVTHDDATHQARVKVGRETWDYFAAQDGARLRVASRLVGWDIQLVCDG